MSTSMIVTSGMMPELESAMLPTRTCGAVCLEAFEKKKKNVCQCAGELSSLFGQYFEG